MSFFVFPRVEHHIVVNCQLRLGSKAFYCETLLNEIMNFNRIVALLFILSLYLSSSSRSRNYICDKWGCVAWKIIKFPGLTYALKRASFMCVHIFFFSVTMCVHFLTRQEGNVQRSKWAQLSFKDIQSRFMD